MFEERSRCFRKSIHGNILGFDPGGDRTKNLFARSPPPLAIAIPMDLNPNCIAMAIFGQPRKFRKKDFQMLLLLSAHNTFKEIFNLPLHFTGFSKNVCLNEPAKALWPLWGCKVINSRAFVTKALATLLCLVKITTKLSFFERFQLPHIYTYL